MSRELSAKYGSGKTRELVNRAIRSELVGGEDAIESLAMLSRVLLRLGEHGLPTATARAAVDACRALRDEMGDEIARRYGFRQRQD